MVHFYTAFAWGVIGMAALEVLLAVWVFQKHSSSRLHQFFSLLLVCLAGWTFCSAIEVLIKDTYSIDTWDRALFFFAYIGSYFLLQFAQQYPIPNTQKLLRPVSLAFLILVSFLLFFTDLIIANPEGLDTANIQSLHWLYIAGFLVNWVSALVLLFNGRRKVSGPLKWQVTYLVLGVLLGSIFGMFSSFVLPYQHLFFVPQLWPPAVAFIIFIASVKVMKIAYSNYSVS